MRRCITYHGLALNVNTDLAYFQRIIPCGLTWAEVTSMAQELGAQQSMSDVRERLLYHFADTFGYSDIQKYEDGGTKIEERHLPSSIFDPRPALS